MKVKTKQEMLKKLNSNECDIYFIDFILWGLNEYMCTNMYVSFSISGSNGPNKLFLN